MILWTIILYGLILVGNYFIKAVLVYLVRRRRVTRQDGFTVGIFHPYCNAGGGGEKVLWCAIRALQQQYENLDIVVYTGDRDATPEQILSLAAKRLNAALPRPVRFIYLRSRWLVEARCYPVFTLLGQSLGSVVLGLEAMWRFLPDVYLDTMGYAWTLPLFRWVGDCRVGCYVHYPTITTDMLQRVSEQVQAHNNRAVVARSATLTAAKLLYYRVFAWLYCAAGSAAEVVMVNSSWTKAHIVDLWQRPQTTHLVYPPCDIGPLKLLQHKEIGQVRIVSLGQFRPEKDHPLQIRSLALARDKLTPDLWQKVRLVVIGSCRNEEDEARVDAIKRLASELRVTDNVEFKVNISFEDLQEEFSLGTVGLHTMWKEHFGIGVVECMAAGLVMLAHRSGGPQTDIVDESETSRTGYLAASAEEYADTIKHIVNTPAEELHRVRRAARISVERFSIDSFEKTFLEAMSTVFDDKKTK